MTGVGNSYVMVAVCSTILSHVCLLCCSFHEAFQAAFVF